MTGVQAISESEKSTLSQNWANYRTLIVVTLQLAIAQFSPFFLAFAVNRAAIKTGNASYESFALTDRFNLATMIAAMGFLQAMYFVAGRELANTDSSGYHRAFKSGLMATTLISIILIALSLFISPLLGFFGVEASLLPVADQVGKIAAIGIFPAVLLTLLRVHFVLRGKAWLMTVIYAVGAIAGVAVLQTLTTRAPNMPGILIPVWAVVASNFMTVFLAIVFERFMPGLRLHWLTKSNAIATFKILWSVGWPIGTVVLLESVSMLLSTLLLGQWWHQYLSVHSLVLLWLAIIQVVPLGLSQIVAKQIAVLSANGNHSELLRTAKASLIIALIYSVLTMVLFSLVPVPLGEMFTGSLPPDSFMAIGFALIFPLGGVLSALQTIILVGAALLRGLGQTRAPLFQAFIGYGLLAGVSQVVFAKVFNAGPAGLWWGMIFGFLCTAVALILKVRKEFNAFSNTSIIKGDVQ